MKKLGIIGGLGPMATVYFQQLLTQMSDAKTDQEHMDIYLISHPSIPDRTNYIVGKSDKSPISELVHIGEKLKQMGADILATPCITAHYFHDELENRVGLPLINAVEETVAYLEQRKVVRAGILATDGTIQSGLFQKALRQTGIANVIPKEISQKMIMDIIYKNIKAGEKIDMISFRNVSDELREKGAQVILLACTELSLIKKEYHMETGYLDVMEVLASRAVTECNHLKPEYRELIT